MSNTEEIEKIEQQLIRELPDYDLPYEAAVFDKLRLFLHGLKKEPTIPIQTVEAKIMKLMKSIKGDRAVSEFNKGQLQALLNIQSLLPTVEP